IAETRNDVQPSAACRRQTACGAALRGRPRPARRRMLRLSSYAFGVQGSPLDPGSLALGWAHPAHRQPERAEPEPGCGSAADGMLETRLVKPFARQARFFARPYIFKEWMQSSLAKFWSQHSA